jgi:hypothetical protein
MKAMLGTLMRTAILDDAAYQEWRERPNLFLRGIILIAIVTLVAGLITFAVNLVTNVRPIDVVGIEEAIEQSMEMQYRFNPGFQDPEIRAMIEGTMGVVTDMLADIFTIESPLPRPVSGFFQSFGSYLSRVLAALGGWMLYGALVLVVVNLLGGSAKLPDFLGMVSLYSIPGLLGLLGPIPCLGALLVLAGTIWSIVVYVKAVSAASDLDTGKSVLAVFAPFIVLFLLALVLGSIMVVWIALASS